MFKVCANYENLSWILNIEQFEEDSVEGWVELDGDEFRIAEVTSADLDNLMLMHYNNIQLFHAVINANFDKVMQAAVDYEAAEYDRIYG